MADTNISCDSAEESPAFRSNSSSSIESYESHETIFRNSNTSKSSTGTTTPANEETDNAKSHRQDSTGTLHGVVNTPIKARLRSKSLCCPSSSRGLTSCNLPSHSTNNAIENPSHKAFYSRAIEADADIRIQSRKILGVANKQNNVITPDTPLRRPFFNPDTQWSFSSSVTSQPLPPAASSTASYNEPLTFSSDSCGAQTDVTPSKPGEVPVLKNQWGQLLCPLTRTYDPSPDQRPIEELLARRRLPRSPAEYTPKALKCPETLQDIESRHIREREAFEMQKREMTEYKTKLDAMEKAKPFCVRQMDK